MNIDEIYRRTYDETIKAIAQHPDPEKLLPWIQRPRERSTTINNDPMLALVAFGLGVMF